MLLRMLFEKHRPRCFGVKLSEVSGGLTCEQIQHSKLITF